MSDAPPNDPLIRLTDVTIGEEEVAAAARVLRSGWLTMGPEVAAFEVEFAAAVGAPHAVAVASGTAALRLAYRACGLGPGDAFAAPALTFIATLAAGLGRGARPVPIDCASEDDLTLSAADLARKFGEDVKLVVTMPYGGHPPDMAAIGRLAAARGAAVVEDAAHAPLARLDGRCLGTFGAAGCFSFFSNKNLATGEGGMIVTADAALADHLRRLRSHSMTSVTWDRERGHAADYDVLEVADNARMDEVRAAIGREQLKKLPAANAARARAAAGLRARIEALGVKGLRVPFAAPRGEPAHHLFVVLLPPQSDRSAVREALRRRAIQTSVHYPPPWALRALRDLPGATPADLPVLAAIHDRLLTLPLGPTLAEADLDRVAAALGVALAG